MNTKDKVRGCFLGIAIGDALGKPVETMTANTISEHWGGRITDYFSNPHHKYFDGTPAGSWTDDTQLSLAVARGFFDGDFNLDTIAETHCQEFVKSVAGWGASTRESVAKIVDGVHWSQASLTDVKGRGTGNGVSMKVAPVGLYMALTNPQCNNPQWTQDINKLVQLATMTHFTSMAITSGIAQAMAVFKCFHSEPDTFDPASFCRTVVGSGEMGRKYLFRAGEDDLKTRFELLEKYQDYPPERIIEELKGSCYVYDSLPFTYMFFLRNPNNIESMYDVVSAGGDTDSNGSMLGALLGALHGTDIFPEHLVDGLREREAVMEVADKFYERVTERV